MPTLGLPDTVDFYVVGDAVTPEVAQSSMAEQIVRLGDLGAFHQRSRSPSERDVVQVRGCCWVVVVVSSID